MRKVPANSRSVNLSAHQSSRDCASGPVGHSGGTLNESGRNMDDSNMECRRPQAAAFYRAETPLLWLTTNGTRKASF